VRLGAGDWIPILLPLIVSIAVFMLVFMLVAIRKSRISLALGLMGVLCWAGAITSEAVEGGFWRLDVTYAMRGVVEEGFELLGTTVLLIAFLEFNRRQSLIPQRSMSTPEFDPGDGNEVNAEIPATAPAADPATEELSHEPAPDRSDQG
jgi:hypothetical protein